MKTTHEIIIGDSRKMLEVPDKSVHLVVTSPPYWQLKDYGDADQIGFNNSYEDYINNLNLVWYECNRVLHPGCKMLINIGDQFARAIYYGRYKVIPIRTEIIKFCETIGFDYMGAIIWQKKTTMNTTGGASVMGSYPYPRNGIVEIDYEFILIFKKMGKPPAVSKEIKSQSSISKERWKEYFSGHWYFNGARQNNHIAMFPLELPKRALEMFTFVGETVLDPFLGSGTSSLAAMNTGRNSIGYEINSDFRSIIESKLKGFKSDLFGCKVNISKQRRNKVNWKSEIRKLPYIFKDTMAFNNKMDQKKLKFGSKIGIEDINGSEQRQEYFTVKEILDTNLIKLSNDLIVKLIGILPVRNRAREARQFLEKKIGKGRIYLKFDGAKFDEENNLFAYVYMKNRTFINAHLIKYGFADVETSTNYKYKSKFINLKKASVVREI